MNKPFLLKTPLTSLHPKTVILSMKQISNPGPDFTNKLKSMLNIEFTIVLKSDNRLSWDCYWVWVCLWNRLKIVDLTLSKLLYLSQLVDLSLWNQGQNYYVQLSQYQKFAQSFICVVLKNHDCSNYMYCFLLDTYCHKPFRSCTYYMELRINDDLKYVRLRHKINKKLESK